MTKTRLIVFATLWEAEGTLDVLHAASTSSPLLYEWPGGLILISGLGAIQAAIQTTQYLPHVDEVWNFGIVGALSPSILFGETKRVSLVGKHLHLPKKTDSHSKEFGSKHLPVIEVPPLNNWRLLTSDYPIHDISIRDSLASEWDVVDMEGYGIVSAAKAAGNPCRLWKVVSDLCCAGGWETIGRRKNELNNKLADAVRIAFDGQAKNN